MVSNPSLSKTERGALAEVFARRFLESRGYRTIEANFRWKGGEIDLVMVDERARTLVFVEVRSARESSPFLRYTLSAAKRRRLVATAHRYALQRPWSRAWPRRFDAVWIETGRQIEHWKNLILR